MRNCFVCAIQGLKLAQIRVHFLFGQWKVTLPNNCFIISKSFLFLNCNIVLIICICILWCREPLSYATYSNETVNTFWQRSPLFIVLKLIIYLTCSLVIETSIWHKLFLTCILPANHFVYYMAWDDLFLK